MVPKSHPHPSDSDTPLSQRSFVFRRLSPAQIRTSAIVFIVTVSSGLLFSVSAMNTRAANNSDGDLVSLVRQRQEVVTSLNSEMSGMRSEIDGYLEMEGMSAGTPTLSTTPLASSAVRGPGLTITLTDAPNGALPEGASPDDLVIHQQDIEDVMNALWSGGAEALTVQGVRVTSQTVIRCIGNVILVGGTSYSPPYEISAIGNVSQLKEAVNNDPRIVNYKAYVALYGLGWKIEESELLEFPAAPQEAAPRFAQVLEDNG